MTPTVDVVIVGAGQAGLATAYYLQRHNRDADRRGGRRLSFALIDGRERPGGAWNDGWSSLRLFSPAAYSSLPGWQMPPWLDGDPPAAHVREYLTAYEVRYDLPVHRPALVDSVRHDGDSFTVGTNAGTWRTSMVVSATGTWDQPHWPSVPGMSGFAGFQIHASDYTGPAPFDGRQVAVVGGANSGAQIAADLTGHAEVTWLTRGAPAYLPDDVDGRVLFQTATEHVAAARRGESSRGVASLGDIVAVPAVRRARDSGLLTAEPMAQHLDAGGLVWADGSRRDIDGIIWCTGFRPALRHLRELRLTRQHGHPVTDGEVPTRSADHPGLYLVGYGDWTGPASATLIGVGATARVTVDDVARQLS